MKTAENRHFSFFQRVPAFACVRARYRNFICTLRIYMKSLRFFLLYRGIFAKQKPEPLFFSAFRSLAPAVRPDDGG
ncbi:hypothetical protein HK19_12960 [Acetobacter persici]|nr:hypothetical protein HK19_12960 [Acetobacter persici]